MKNLFIVFTAVLLMMFSSCSKDRDFNGQREDVEKFLGEEFVMALDQANFKMNFGDKPPQIEGMFKVNPAELKSSTVPGDPATRLFNDLTLTFENQNNKDLTVEYEGDQVSENSVGLGTFISGTKKDFTVAMKTKSTKEGGGEAETAFVISGRMTNSGIADIEVAVFNIKIIIEDTLVPFIPENTGRILQDGNGIASRL